MFGLVCCSGVVRLTLWVAVQLSRCCKCSLYWWSHLPIRNLKAGGDSRSWRMCYLGRAPSLLDGKPLGCVQQRRTAAETLAALVCLHWSVGSALCASEMLLTAGRFCNTSFLSASERPRRDSCLLQDEIWRDDFEKNLRSRRAGDGALWLSVGELLRLVRRRWAAWTVTTWGCQPCASQQLKACLERLQTLLWEWVQTSREQTLSCPDFEGSLVRPLIWMPFSGMW